MTRALRESFVPILLVLLAVFLLLAYVQYEVGLEADQVTVIAIAADSVASGEDGEAELQHLVVAEHLDDPALAAADQLLEKQLWAEAEALYRRLLEEQPSSSRWTALAALLLQRGRDEEALVALEEAMAVAPVDTSAYFYRGVFASRNGDRVQAEEDYHRVIAANPYHYEAHYNLGLLLLRDGAAEEAIAALQQAVQLGGGERRAQASYQLGRALLLLQPADREQARAQFLTAIRLQPGYVAPRLRLAELEQDEAAAMAWLEQALLLDPQSVSVHFQLASFHTGKGRTAEAISHYRQVIELQPNHAEAHYNLGLLLLREQDWLEARQRFTAVLALQPDNARARFNRGRASYRLVDYDAALTDYQAALELHGGDYPEALLNIGLIHAAQQHYPEAVAAYQEAIAAQGAYPAAWYNLGLAHMRSDDYPAAIEAFRTAIAERADYPQAWYNLGILYGREGRNEEAIDAYQHAIELRPDYRAAQLNLAVRWSRSGDYPRAIALYQEILEKNPSYSLAWSNLGSAYLAMGRYEEAEQPLREAVRLEPNEPGPVGELARALAGEEKFAEAFAAFDAALDMDAGDVQLRLDYARALRKAGRVDEAQRQLAKGLALSPDDEQLQREAASMSDSSESSR